MPCLVPTRTAYVIRVASSGPSILLGCVTQMLAWDRASHWGRKEKKMGERSEPRVVGLGRKNVLSMRELFCPDPLARYEKMERFQIFFCRIIKRFHS